jgi:CRP/FNR family transcriptional regulator
MTTRRFVRSRTSSLTKLTVTCTHCGLRDLCFPPGMPEADLLRLERLITKRLSVPQGAHLYSVGEPFKAIYAVRTGLLKTSTSLENGREHVSGFHMAGELLGFEGIGFGVHTRDAVALEDSKVCVMPYGELEVLAREFPRLQRHLHRLMGREIVRNHGVMLLLSSMRSEVRVAAFVLNLSQRLESRGFSGAQLLLRMTREEIGTYLGLTTETVSRALSRFDALGMLKVRGRDVEVLDQPALERLVQAVSIPASAGGDVPEAPRWESCSAP